MQSQPEIQGKPGLPAAVARPHGPRHARVCEPHADRRPHQFCQTSASSTTCSPSGNQRRLDERALRRRGMDILRPGTTGTLTRGGPPPVGRHAEGWDDWGPFYIQTYMASTAWTARRWRCVTATRAATAGSGRSGPSTWALPRLTSGPEPRRHSPRPAGDLPSGRGGRRPGELPRRSPAG